MRVASSRANTSAPKLTSTQIVPTSPDPLQAKRRRLSAEPSEAQAGDALEVPPVSGQQNSSVHEHNPRNQAVRHADAHAVALERPPQLSRGIGARVVERETDQPREQVGNDALLP